MAHTRDEVHQLIKTKVRPLAQSAAADAKVALAKVRAAAAKVVRETGKAGDIEMLGTYRRELKIHVRQAILAASALRDALEALADASRDDDDLAADEAEIETVKKGLLAAMNAVKDEVRKAKDIEDAAAAWTGKAEDDEMRASKNWAGVVASAERNRSVMTRQLKACQAWEKEAQAAVKAKDAEALKELQADPPAPMPNDAVMKGTLNATMVAGVVGGLHIDRFGAAFRAELARDTLALKAGDKDMQADAKVVKAILERVAKLKAG